MLRKLGQELIFLIDQMKQKKKKGIYIYIHTYI